ncbi:unnamed protein product [Cuscuta epithymum]|uniref:Uncharacterized protein n=1 Tax=Cuscuta epithymum TaxID=186058 RepID=A0AAV0FLX4_9ASTE|nr:unnamed protein product [Cuscuta epithymum]
MTQSLSWGLTWYGTFHLFIMSWISFVSRKTPIKVSNKAKAPNFNHRGYLSIRKINKVSNRFNIPQFHTLLGFPIILEKRDPRLGSHDFIPIRRNVFDFFQCRDIS